MRIIYCLNINWLCIEWLNFTVLTVGPLHGDTQAQSTPVFGLAYLLGIKLMPRIRNIKDLNFYKPDHAMVLTHIQPLLKPYKFQ